MLNLKLADLYADLTIRTNKWDTTLKKIKSGVDAATMKPLDIVVNTSSLDAAFAKIKAFRSSVGPAVRVATGGGSSGGVGSVARQTWAAQDAAARKAAKASADAARDTATVLRNEARNSAAVAKQFMAGEVQAARDAARAKAQAAKQAARDTADAAKAAARQQSQAARDAAVTARNEAKNSAAVMKQFMDGEVQAARDAARAKAQADRQAARDIASAAKDASRQKAQAARDAVTAAKQLASEEAKLSRDAARAVAKDARDKATATRKAAQESAKANKQLYDAEQRGAKAAAAAVARLNAAKAARGRDFLRGATMGTGLPYMGMGGPWATAGFALTSAAGHATREFADIQTAMREIQRFSGMSADNAERFKKEMLEAATQLPGVSSKDLFGMADIGARAGVGPSSLGQFAIDLATVKNAITDMPVEELGTSIVKLLNNFEMGTDKLKALGSALVKMDNLSVATARDILDVATGMSGAAHSVGMTPQQTLAMASVAKDAGLENDVGGSSLSQILRVMATKRDKFANAAGMHVQDYEKLYKASPLEAFLRVLKGINAETDKIKKQDLVKSLGLSGVRTGGAILQMAANVDKITPRVDAANKEFEKQGALVEANALKSGTYWQKVQELENTWTKFSETMGSTVAPAIEGAMSVLIEGLKLANNLINEFKSTWNWAFGQTANAGAGMAGSLALGLKKGGTAPGAPNRVAAPTGPIRPSVDPKDVAAEEKRQKALASVYSSDGNRLMRPGEKGTEIKPGLVQPFKGNYGQYGSGLEAGQALQDRLFDSGKEQLDELKKLNQNVTGLRDDFKKWKPTSDQPVLGP